MSNIFNEKEYTFEEAVLELMKQKEIFHTSLQETTAKKYFENKQVFNESYAVRVDKTNEQEDYSFKVAMFQNMPIQNSHNSKPFEIAPDDFLHKWYIRLIVKD